MHRALAVLTICCIAWAQPAWSADYVSMSGEDLYRGSALPATVFKAVATVRLPHRFASRCRTSLAWQVAQDTVNVRDRVARIIDGRYIIGAHGTRVMPVWGEDLARLEIGNPDAERSAQVIIGRLADYVSSLQKPAAK